MRKLACWLSTVVKRTSLLPQADVAGEITRSNAIVNKLFIIKVMFELLFNTMFRDVIRVN